MQLENFTTSRTANSALAVNSVLRKTYLLLGLTLIFSGIMAGVAMVSNTAPLSPLLVIGGYFGLLLMTTWLRNSPMGLVGVFALTGFMGYTLGPLLNLYLHNFVNGSQIIMTALGGTGLIFFGLSGYALVSRKDFSFMTGFITIGALVGFIVSLAGVFFHMTSAMLAASAIFIFISSGIILIQTSAIIRGGETNYIMATISLYVSLYNLFVSLLNILGFMNSRD